MTADPIVPAFEALTRGEWDEAERQFRALLLKDPGRAEAWHGLACIALGRGQAGVCIALLGRALALPALAEDVSARLHVTLGHALMREGHHEPARAAFTVAVALLPGEAAVHAGLAEAYSALGRLEPACRSWDMSVRLAPENPVLHTKLGQALLAAGRAAEAEAEAAFRAALTFCPQDGAAHANLAAVLLARQNLDEAHALLLKALSLGAETAESFNNLGLVSMARGSLTEAWEFFEKARVLHSEDGRIALNLGTVLDELRQEEQAAHLFSHLMTTEPQSLAGVQARFNRATIGLGQGKFSEAWRDFESRHALLGVKETLPLWDGSEGDGAVAVTAEQGLGDLVQFLRFLPQAAARRPLRLDFPETALSLIPFLEDLKPERRVPPGGAAVAQVSLMSLPFVLNLHEKPETAPYLSLPAGAESPREAAEPGLVGLCWAGNPAYRFDRLRSVPAEMLRPLAEIPGVHFLSLQKDLPPPFPMEEAALDTLADLARAIARCALVISVDTLTAHLAGAMGRPLWLLNRYGGDWRWKTIPWYRAVRQFRPAEPAPPASAWPPVLRDVAASLSAWSKKLPD